MKRNSKGFTLIELLSIIVILAIIALITTYSLLNVIEKIKIEAAKSSVYGYLESVSQNLEISYLKNDPTLKFPDDNDLTSGNDDDELVLEQIKVKGKKPDFITLQFDNNKIINGGFCINGYNLTYDGTETKETNTDYCKFALVKSISIENTENEIYLDTANTVQLNTVLVPNDITPIYTSSDESIATVSSTGLITALKTGEVTITAKAGIKKATFTLLFKENESLLGKIIFNKYENDTINNIVANGETYSSHIYNYEGDQIWTSNMTFGNSSDVGSASTNAVNTVVVKVNGNLTINSGVTVGSYNSTYGGPKGLILYVSGTLTNNGLISGSTRGAKGPGQNVYLWKNDNETYEYIPAVGANGGDGRSGNGDNRATYFGNPGIAGTARKTGGGGSGSAQTLYVMTYSGAGSPGTSYAGGSGGGGAFYGATANNGIAGGSGGDGKGNNLSGWSWSCGGGAGLPGGTGINGGITGGNGSGGLVVIAAKSIINNNTIVSNGSAGGNGYRTGGGGSGGGSINLFYKNTITNGTLTSIGGNGGVGTRVGGEASNGGIGGSGSVTIQKKDKMFPN